MSLSLDISALRRLRGSRRPLVWIAAVLLFAVSLAGALGQCLATGSTSLIGSIGSDTAERSTMPGEMPCADCTVGGDSRSLDETLAAVPESQKSGFVLALVVVSAVLALGFPKSIPIPPRPRLPKRPRTLKFCVLRI